MASAPSPSQFQVPAKGNVEQWLGSFVRVLNVFIVQAVRAIQDLQAAGPKYKTLTLTTGATVANSFPVQIQNPLDRTPLEIQVATINPVVTTAAFCNWTLTSNGDIQVTSVTGLTTNTSYEIRLSIS